MGDAIDKFAAAVRRIDSITSSYGAAEKANGLPAKLVQEVERVKLTQAYGDNLTEDAKKAMGAARLAAIEMERQRGEQERDAQLHKLGLELEALRAILPALAAKASIELGEIARSYMGGANG